MKQCCALLWILFCICAFGATEDSSGPAVGTLAPDFKVHNVVTGEDVTLSSQRGKVVIVTFWASWCPPCKRELPILEGAQRAVSKDRLVVFAVNYRDSDAALAAIKKPAANWQINIMKDRAEHVASLYSISKIPHLFMIGRDGKIVIWVTAIAPSTNSSPTSITHWPRLFPRTNVDKILKTPQTISG